MALVFDLVVSGVANNGVINYVSRALVNCFTFKLAVEVLQDTKRFHLYNTYTDLFLTAKESQNRILEGIPSENLNKVRLGTGDAKADNIAENALKAILRNEISYPAGARDLAC